MANPRLAGQDTEISVLVDGEVVNDFTAVKSFDLTYKMSTKTEEYLGETGPRKDDFFEGLSGRIELDLEGIGALELIDAIKTRAQNRGSSTKISVKTTLQFPDGDRAIINIPNTFYSDIPLNMAGRTEYGKITLNWEAENGKIVTR
jgi:hypothetical protein